MDELKLNLIRLSTATLAGIVAELRATRYPSDPPESPMLEAAILDVLDDRAGRNDAVVSEWLTDASWKVAR